MPRVIHSYGAGRVDVYPFKKEDFNMIIRILLIRMEKSKRGSNEYFRAYRNYVMFILGVNTGCRIETLLQLTPKHIDGGCVRIKEFKTNKVSRYELNKDVYAVVAKFIDYLGITSREYIFRKSPSCDKPLTRQQAYNIIKDVANEVGIKYAVGCHSLRKSYGRFVYDETRDIHLVQRLLNHSNPIITQNYICLEDREVTKRRKIAKYGLDI